MDTKLVPQLTFFNVISQKRLLFYFGRVLAAGICGERLLAVDEEAGADVFCSVGWEWRGVDGRCFGGLGAVDGVADCAGAVWRVHRDDAVLNLYARLAHVERDS